MGIFEHSMEWAKNYLPSKDAKTTNHLEGVSKQVKDLRGDEYKESVQLWKQQIEKGIAGEYGSEYKFTDKELGIQNARLGKHLFITIDKNSSLLNSEILSTFLNEGFEKNEGSVNTVFSKIIENSENAKEFQQPQSPFLN